MRKRIKEIPNDEFANNLYEIEFYDEDNGWLS